MQNTQNNGHCADSSQDCDNQRVDLTQLPEGLTKDELVDMLIESTANSQRLHYEYTRARDQIATLSQQLQVFRTKLEQTQDGYHECVTDKITGILLGETSRDEDEPRFMMSIHQLYPPRTRRKRA